MDYPQPGPSTSRNDECDEETKDFRSKIHFEPQCIYNSNDNETDSEDTTSINYIEEVYKLSATMSKQIHSESETSVESEGEDLYEFIKINENDEEWTCDGDLKNLVFNEIYGLKCLPNGSDPYDFFELLFDTNFFLNIVTETNKYAFGKRGDEWKNITVEEFKTFVGLLLHMGTIKCPSLQYYWSTHQLFSFNSFSQHMSKMRFEQILSCLQLFSNSTNNDHLNKISSIIDCFNVKMKEVYYPQKEISIHEIMIPWTGRLVFRQFTTGKKYKYGIRLHALTDRSGMIIRMNAHKGSGKGIHKKIVVDLLEDFLQKGHSVYIDNFYNDYELVKELLEAKTYCTGLLRKFKKGNSVNVVKGKLAKGEVISRYKNNIMMGKYQDKRETLFISSEFNADYSELKSKKRRKYKKPLALYKYSKFMNNINKKDQILSYYTYYVTNSFKWYIKFWINTLEILLLNSFFLYARDSTSLSKLNSFDFRLNIINMLIFKNNGKNTLVALPNFTHVPEILSTDEKNRIKRKRCRQCFSNGSRRNTKFFCKGCADKPGLCLGVCFAEYHKNLL